MGAVHHCRRKGASIFLPYSANFTQKKLKKNIETKKKVKYAPLKYIRAKLALAKKIKNAYLTYKNVNEFHEPGALHL